MSGPVGAPSAAASLVGRDRELAVLRSALDAGLSGRGSLVLIGGEAGIGKTALAEAALAEAAERGAVVRVGRCYDRTETPPYGPWIELFRPARAGHDGPSPPPLSALEDARAEAPFASRAAILDRMRDFLAALAARRPQICLLDDLHWADPASLDLLRVLARDLPTLAVIFLVTHRTEEMPRDHPLSRLLPLLLREAPAALLDLRPLGSDDTYALMTGSYRLAAEDAARLADYLHRHAQGNPLFTRELLRGLEETRLLQQGESRWLLGDLSRVQLSGVLQQIIAMRMDRLGEEARRRLAVAAAIGQEVPLGLWATVAGMEEEALLAVVERMTEARLLEETSDGTRVRFHHALIREALYEGIPPARRRHAHRRIGEALAASADPDPDAVADQFRRASDGRAVAWLVAAGERAQRAYACLTAGERFAAALALLDGQGGDARRRGWLIFQIAVLRGYADARQTLADARRVKELAGEAGDHLLAAVARFLEGLALGYLNQRGRGIALMTAGLAALDALPEAERVPPGATAPLDLAERHGTVVLHLAQAGRYAEAVALGERYLAEAAVPTTADWLGGNPYADAYVGLGTAHAALGRPEQAIAAFARAKALNQAVGHHARAGTTAVGALWVAEQYGADRPDVLRRLLAEISEAFAQAAEVEAEPIANGSRARLLRQAGRWAELRELASAYAVWETLFAVEVGRLGRAQGEPEIVGAWIRAAFANAPSTEPGDAYMVGVLELQRLMADLALDEGDLAAARDRLAMHDRWLGWGGAVLGQAEGALGWAAYWRAAGDRAQARAHAGVALAHAADPRQPLALLAAHRTLGELDTTDGCHDDAQAHLDAALALADACEAPYERALTLLAIAELRAAEGGTGAADAFLADARAILEPLGARPALARASALAVGLPDGMGRAAAVPAPAAPRFGLTAREVEVLRLVAEGLTDAQVAARLSLSPRTVGQHLRAIYNKLGVENRTAATRLAVAHGIA